MTSHPAGSSRIALFLGTVALAGGLAACGSSSSSSNGEAAKPATQILSDAKAATDSATSVRVAGKINDSSGSISLNLVLGRGAGGGSVSEGGSSFDVVVHAPNVYLRADEGSLAKLAGNAAAAKLLAGKWLQSTTANADLAPLADLTDVTKLTDNLTPTGSLSKGSVTTFDGASAIPLEDSGGSQGTLYVAATGKPYILGIAKGGSDGGKVTFTQYGSATPPPAPSGALNFDQLSQGAG